MAVRLKDAMRFALRIAQRARILKLAGFGIITITLGSLAAYLAERHVADSRLSEYGDALWWALNMFTNVAYVDFQPATVAGRVVDAILEFLGIAFIGVFAGSVANALLREPDQDAPSTQPAAREESCPEE